MKREDISKIFEGATEEQINALQSEVASVIEKKSALDEQNELNRQDIELINAQIALYDQMIEDKAQEVAEAVRAEEEQFAHYCSRVRTMEETNEWKYISFIFEADSLTDFLGRLNDVNGIIRYDRHVKDEYIAARENVEQVKAAIAANRPEGRYILIKGSNGTRLFQLPELL